MRVCETLIRFCFSIVIGINLCGCSSKPGAVQEGPSTNPTAPSPPSTTEFNSYTSLTTALARSVLSTGGVWRVGGDPYGIRDLLPEASTTPLDYSTTRFVGELADTDKRQLALLAGRLRIVSGSFRRIDTIVVTSPSNAELFVRIYQLSCAKDGSGVWSITDVTSKSH